MLVIRPFHAADETPVWDILRPIIRAGEAYALPTAMELGEFLTYWLAPGNQVFVAEEDGIICGSYFLRANQKGGGAHVSNCGYATASWAVGRGVARRMCEHSIEQARAMGFKAMQFNFVISSNEAAVHLWQKCGFVILARLPEAFQHPRLGFVDAYVMHRML